MSLFNEQGWYLIDTTKRRAVFDIAWIPDQQDPAKLYGFEVSLKFKKAGITIVGTDETAGYELYVAPIVKHQQDGYTMQELKPADGHRIKIKEAGRYNAKTLEKLAGRISPGDIVQNILNRGGNPGTDDENTIQHTKDAIRLALIDTILNLRV